MEVVRITLLSLLLCMAYVPYAAAADPIYAEVGEVITLPCPSGATETNVFRNWYRGSYDGSGTAPGKENLIYRAGPGGEDKSGMRPDMKVDPNTFALTLTVQNSPIDNGYFTCETELLHEKYDLQQVLIFLEPVIDITTDVKPEEGVNVTVTCLVKRLYPNITNNQFTMKWNDRFVSDSEFSGQKNEDRSMEYTLQKSKNLTKDDDRVTVECTVTPDANFGKQTMQSLVLNFTVGPTDRPGSGGSNYGATVGKVISGLAVFIIAVVISGPQII